MSVTYLKLFVDCLDKYQKLNDSEFGRLVRAALRYKATGAEPDDLGREALLWDGMRLEIDRDNEAYRATIEARVEAGKKGASKRWQTNGKNGKCHLPYGKNGQEKEEEKENIPPHTPPHGGVDDQSAFERFWAAYPNRKCGKANALKSWNKFKHTSELDEIILSAVERQKAWPDWKKDGGQYIPMATTWLNQRRWDAEQPERGDESHDYWLK